MKKLMWGAAALVVTATLVGCNQLTQYTLSEQELNEYLQNIIIMKNRSVFRVWLMPISP